MHIFFRFNNLRTSAKNISKCVVKPLPLVLCHSENQNFSKLQTSVLCGSQCSALWLARPGALCQDCRLKGYYGLLSAHDCAQTICSLLRKLRALTTFSNTCDVSQLETSFLGCFCNDICINNGFIFWHSKGYDFFIGRIGGFY